MVVTKMTSWAANSWREKPCSQSINYPSLSEVTKVVDKLSMLPPLVTPLEIIDLQQQLAAAARGETFLLQGGDCAENFASCRAETITNKLKILLQMSLILIHGLHKPLIRVGRIAGQYAKPRSADMETINGVTLPSYRGDIINKLGFTAAERTPDPQLMLEGYGYAAQTLNYIRALVDGGFADLQHPEYWNLDFIQFSPMADQYNALVASIHDALYFMRAISAMQSASLRRVNFYTSHEALNLYYEEALVRTHSDDKRYDLSTHFPWIGMRTSNVDGAHVEFFRGIANPIAIKIGPTTTKESLLALLDILHPDNEPGRLTLIVRLGNKNIEKQLPMLIETVQSSGKTVLWSCDPMHGNTETTSDGIKTRRFDDILAELRQSFRIHKSMGSYLGGVHIELTGENVTECTGGARGLTDADLQRAYESLVDPRLNYEQALEMAILITQNAE